MSNLLLGFFFRVFKFVNYLFMAAPGLRWRLRAFWSCRRGAFSLVVEACLAAEQGRVESSRVRDRTCVPCTGRWIHAFLFYPKQIGHTLAHTCPPLPTNSVPASAWKFCFPPIGTCLDSPDSVDGTGGRHRVPSIDRCLPRGSWGVRGPDPVVGDSRTD